MKVELLWSPAPREVLSLELDVPAGSRVLDVIKASGWLAQHEALTPLPSVGVWGRKCPPEQVLEPGDRIEIYRPLRVDPKVARRERFATQGARRTGLFAKRRPGAKPGY